MTKLSEIEAAAEAWWQKEKEELFLFLAARLRAGKVDSPPPRDFSREQLNRWIADDEAGHRGFFYLTPSPDDSIAGDLFSKR